MFHDRPVGGRALERWSELTGPGRIWSDIPTESLHYWFLHVFAMD